MWVRETTFSKAFRAWHLESAYGGTRGSDTDRYLCFTDRPHTVRAAALVRGVFVCVNCEVTSHVFSTFYTLTLHTPCTSHFTHARQRLVRSVRWPTRELVVSEVVCPRNVWLPTVVTATSIVAPVIRHFGPKTFRHYCQSGSVLQTLWHQGRHRRHFGTGQHWTKPWSPVY